MKARWLGLVLIILLLVTALWADNKARIAELQGSLRDHMVNIQILQNQVAKVQGQIKDEENAAWKIQGAIEELQKQDADAEAKAKAEKLPPSQPTK